MRGLLPHGYTGSKIDGADVIDDLARTRRVIGYNHRDVGREEDMASLHQKNRGFIEKDSAMLRSHRPPDTRAVLDVRTGTKFGQLGVEAFENRRAWLAAVEEHLARADAQGDAR